MDEVKLAEAQARGKRAELLLGDDLLQGAFAYLENEYITKWRTTHQADQQAREKLFLAVNVIGKVKEHLSEALMNGKVAERNLEDLTRDKKRGIFRVI